MYDYGWRQYMPDIGKWNGMDQLSEMYQSFSPYAYVVNNPTMLTDPDGRWINENGNMSDRSGQTFFLMGNSFKPHLQLDADGRMYSNSSNNPTFGSTDAYRDIMSAYYSGGTAGAQVTNGVLKWWTDESGTSIGHYWMLKLKGGIKNNGFWNHVWNKAVNFMNSFVFQVDGKGTFGVQLGLEMPFGSLEGGIMTGDLGSFGWSNRKGAYAVGGDSKGHNFAGGSIKLLADRLSAGGKLDYITNDIMPTEGSDLLEYYPNNGSLEWEGNIGPSQANNRKMGLDTSIGPKIKVGNAENCSACATFGGGFKAFLGLDINIIVGFK